MIGRTAACLLVALLVRAAPVGAASSGTVASRWSADTTEVRTPSLVAPADTARDVGVRPLFLWHPAADSALYRIRIGTDSLAFGNGIEDSVSADTAYRPGVPLLNDSLYYWRVEVRDSAGISIQSGIRSFRVAPPPILSAAEVAFEFVRRGDTARASFELRNPLGRSIMIDSGWSDPGRFRVLTPLPASVDSLGILRIDIAYVPEEYVEVGDTLRLRTELGDPLLRVTGDSPPPLAVAGQESIPFPPAAVGDTTYRSVVIHNRGWINTLTVSRFRLRLRTIQAMRRVPFSIGPRDSATVRFRFAPGAVRSFPYGFFTDTLVIETDGGAPTVELRAEHPAPRLSALPRSIEFGSLAVGDSVWRRVAIAAGSITPLRIDSVRVGNSAFRIAPIRRTLRVRDTLLIPIRFNPQRYGAFPDTLLIFSNALPAVTRIPLRGTVPPPLLVPDQKSLDFGEVPARETARLVVGISSGSISGLVIDSVTTRTRRFRVEQFPQFTSLRQGDTLRVGVTFAPDTGLVFRDTLVIYNNSSTPRWRIPLFGIGRAALRQDEGSPGSFSLMQNYPNPFTGSTTFRYVLPERCAVRLSVYSSLGQVIAVVVDGEEEQGFHDVLWRAETASGMYFFKLIATSLVHPDRQYQATKRLMILR